jgi:hypothetical protein
MTEILDEIYTAIHEVDKEGYAHGDWPVYVPSDRMDEVISMLDEYTHMEVYKKGHTIAGKDIIPDPFVVSPVVLPRDTSDIRRYLTHENPPRKLLEQVVDAYAEAYADTLRGTTNYTTTAFYEVEDEHRRLNRNTHRKYGFACDSEYDKEPNELERMKIGFQFTSELGASANVDDYARNQLIDGVNKHIHHVSRQPIRKTRTRTLKGPYPVLDIEHTERIRVGTDYTHYGGVLLKCIDTRAQKMEILNRDSDVFA